MAPVNRRATYELHPSKKQKANLWQCLKLHCDHYNAARRERIDAYRLAGKSISHADQCRSLAEIRADNAEYLALNAQSAQGTLERLDHAFGCSLPSRRR